MQSRLQCAEDCAKNILIVIVWHLLFIGQCVLADPVNNTFNLALPDGADVEVTLSSDIPAYSSFGLILRRPSVDANSHILTRLLQRTHSLRLVVVCEVRQGRIRYNYYTRNMQFLALQVDITLPQGVVATGLDFLSAAVTSPAVVSVVDVFHPEIVQANLQALNGLVVPGLLSLEAVSTYPALLPIGNSRGRLRLPGRFQQCFWELSERGRSLCVCGMQITRETNDDWQNIVNLPVQAHFPSGADSLGMAYLFDFLGGGFQIYMAMVFLVMTGMMLYGF